VVVWAAVALVAALGMAQHRGPLILTATALLLELAQLHRMPKVGKHLRMVRLHKVAQAVSLVPWADLLSLKAAVWAVAALVAACLEVWVVVTLVAVVLCSKKAVRVKPSQLASQSFSCC
jgi:hypothetical protein